jgi:hypothetical protein
MGNPSSFTFLKNHWYKVNIDMDTSQFNVNMDPFSKKKLSKWIHSQNNINMDTFAKQY